MKLPVLDRRRAETNLCTYCPKLCRPACPVSTVEGRETVTPWGKMRALGEVVRGVVPVEPPYLAPPYACTGCMRCTTQCELDNPVADALRDGRAMAFAARVAPVEATGFVQGFSARERALERLAGDLEATTSPRARTALLPGCTAAVFEPREVARLGGVIARLAGSCEQVVGQCCGLPLLEAGDRDGFMQRAAAMAERLAPFERVVVDDPGCAHLLRAIMPSYGFTLPRVVHTAELAAASLASIPALRDAPRDVAYHDACRLGRGLGVYDEPRAVLTRLLGRAPLELDEARERGLCSGGGALLPRTRPETSRAIARDTIVSIRATGSITAVTTCAASRRQFAREGLATVGFGELIARAFDPGGSA